MNRRKIAASTFIVAYICITTLSLLPVSKLRNALLDPIRPVILYTGLWQSFILFAPDPPTSNVDLTARITLRDGQTFTWRRPDTSRLNLFERCEKQRTVNFSTYYVNYNDVFQPDFARYLARLYKPADASNVPTSVTFERHWADIPAPSSGALGVPTGPLSAQGNCVVSTYSIKPTDL